MNEVHLRMRLACGLEVLLVELLDCQLLEGVIHLVLGRLLGLYMSQSIDLHSQYIHSFSIIDGL